jgi:glucan phosphoethanolaminetransferase (alkaline phosphatase superfamily)
LIPKLKADEDKPQQNSMELLTPEIGLILWTLLAFINILLCIIFILKLAKNKLIDPTTKLVWLLAIIFIPFAGLILYLKSYKSAASDKAES